MRSVLRPLPVLYACQGCAEFGQIARDVATFVDTAGAAEMAWLGAAADTQPTSRYPIYALDACDKACARRWLEERGVDVQRSYVLACCDPRSAPRAAQHIAAELGSPG